jgi:gas vesicle protein
MIRRKQKYWTECFNRFFNFLDLLEDDIKLEKVDIEIIWKDGLPTDKKEVAENAIQKVNAKLKSRIRAIMETEDIDEKQATEEMARIQEEQKQNAEIDSQRFRVQVQ